MLVIVIAVRLDGRLPVGEHGGSASGGASERDLRDEREREREREDGRRSYKAVGTVERRSEVSAQPNTGEGIAGGKRRIETEGVWCSLMSVKRKTALRLRMETIRSDERVAWR